MRRALAAALVLWAAVLPAQEADYLSTEGKLSGEDFYRLVSCRATPGGPCTLDPVRWADTRARDLRVLLVDPPEGYPPALARRMSAALDHAIAEINAAGAALRLGRTASRARADIRVHLAPVREGDAIRGTGEAGVDGQTIDAALVTIWWDEAFELTEAVIVLAEDVPPAEVLPVMLEEMTQAMGLMTDIRNPAYEAVSVFSEDSNRVTRLGPQDREALRRHYPQEAP